MSERDELLPFLTPISGLMDGDGCEWDCRDPLDLLSREEREALWAQLEEISDCQDRALFNARFTYLH
jgi:hypothetical protein